jgi:hypothetical protein
MARGLAQPVRIGGAGCELLVADVVLDLRLYRSEAAGRPLEQVELHRIEEAKASEWHSVPFTAWKR